MSLKHLYVKGGDALLILGFSTKIAEVIAIQCNFQNYNSYTDFTGISPVFTSKFGRLHIYKKDIDEYVPNLGLSANVISYLTINDI